MRNQILLCSVLTLLSGMAFSWSNHTLISHELIANMPELADAPDVQVETLESFLLANEADLAEFLAAQEQVMRTSLWHYADRPEALAFSASGDAATIRQRFTYALRINPNSRLALYLQLLPGETRDGPVLQPEQITVLKDTAYLNDIELLALTSGQWVSPLDVISTASDEPDHGLDIGLFENNDTDYGRLYGFGEQPFGNPALEYGTQAPFHMGFYHEPGIIFAAGGFLKRSFPEYRILQFQQLAEFAFARGHDYWGWRFLGWGLHYVGDFSNPYHATPLPGAGTMKILWPGILGTLGMPKKQNQLTQLASNRHTALEDFQQQVMTRALRLQQNDHPTLQALQPPAQIKAFAPEDVVDVYALKAVERADGIDEVLGNAMPDAFVNDPDIEYADLGVAAQLPDIVREQQGEQAYLALQQAISELLQDFAGHGASYLSSTAPAP